MSGVLSDGVHNVHRLLSTRRGRNDLVVGVLLRIPLGQRLAVSTLARVQHYRRFDLLGGFVRVLVIVRVASGHHGNGQRSIFMSDDFHALPVPSCSPTYASPLTRPSPFIPTIWAPRLRVAPGNPASLAPRSVEPTVSVGLVSGSGRIWAPRSCVAPGSPASLAPRSVEAMGGCRPERGDRVRRGLRPGR